MDFILSRTGLLNNLQAVKNVINTKNTNPILDNFLFDFQGDKLVISGSDGETHMSAQLTLETPETAKLVIPADKLLNTIKNLPEQPLKFSIEDNIMKITAEGGNYVLAAFPGNEFPIPQPSENVFERKIPASLLAEAIHKTLFAVSNDDMRPTLTGVLFHFRPDLTNIVATDAHKLVRFSIKNISSDEEFEFIVPKKPLQIMKSTVNGDDEATVKFSDRKMELHFDNLMLSTTLITGKFPAYEQVIPTHNPYVLILERESFIAALKRVSIYASQTTNLIIMEVQGANLSLTARSEETSSEAMEHLPVNYEGEDIKLGFNAKSLLEIVSNLDGEQIEINMSASNRPVLFKPMENITENEEVLMLLMPISF